MVFLLLSFTYSLVLEVGYDNLYHPPCAHFHSGFILHRSTPADALKKTAQHNAQLLNRREQLQWTKLVDDTCFVIPLLD